MGREVTPGKAAKEAFGPYIGCIVAAAIYAWPFVVFHGTARLAVGIPWLVVSIGITVLILIGNARARNSPKRQP